MDRVYGPHAVRSAVESSRDRVIRVLVQKDGGARVEEIISAARAAGVEVRVVDRRDLDRMTGGARHQGAAAELKPFDYADLDRVLANGTAGTRVGLILDGITDPQNLGAILRSAGAFGASFIVVPKDRSAPVSAVVGKIASGGADVVPVCQVANLSRALEILKAAGFWCYSLEAGGDARLDQIDLSGDAAFVLGSEGKGARPLVRKHTDRVCRIPASGPVASLNVAAAAACALYEAARQRARRDDGLKASRGARGSAE